MDFVGEGRICFVEKTGWGWWALEAVHDGVGQGFGSLASQGPGVADDGVYAPPPAMLLDDADLLIGIGAKAVQRHHGHQAKKTGIGDVFLQIGQTLHQGFGVGFAQLLERLTTVVADGP